MGSMSIRNIPDDAYDALKIRAHKNGRSAEAEVRAMIVESLRRDVAGGFGTRLRGCYAGVEGDELDIARDRSGAEPVTFE